MAGTRADAGAAAVAAAGAGRGAGGTGWWRWRRRCRGRSTGRRGRGPTPFVEVGDEVGEDTVVAIVETMKLMNSVHAGVRGRVAEICLANAEPAAQGATLMLIEPRA